MYMIKTEKEKWIWKLQGAVKKAVHGMKRLEEALLHELKLGLMPKHWIHILIAQEVLLLNLAKGF